MRPSQTSTFLIALALSIGPGCDGCQDDPSDDITPAPADDDDVEVQYDRGYYLDMELDTQGRAWMAFREGERGILQVARLVGAEGEVDTVWDVDGMADTSGPIPVGGFEGGYYASITLDGDTPHVAHWNKEDGGLRYATFDGSAWAAEDVETGDVGQFTDIVVVDGEPLISYYDYDAGALKVARKGATGWQTEVVDGGDIGPDAIEAEIDAPDVGLYTNLLVDETGTVYLAYYDRANGDLKVQRGGFGSWTAAGTWGAAENTGAWPTLTSDGGSIWIAFQHLGTHALWWAQVNGAGISGPVALDENTFVGADSSIAWVDGLAVIAYQDAQYNDVKIAAQDGQGGWTLSTHMADGAVGFHNSVAVDPQGLLAWSCFDHTRTNFVFQRFSL